KKNGYGHEKRRLLKSKKSESEKTRAKKNQSETPGEGESESQTPVVDDGPRQERRGIPVEPRTQRDPEPGSPPGGGRRRGQARPDDPRRRREDALRHDQEGPAPDRRAAARAGTPRQ